MTLEEKKVFIANADPYLVVQEFPFEYTLNMRMGASMWHLSAVLMTELEIKMYTLACEAREFNNEIKRLRKMQDENR